MKKYRCKDLIIGLILGALILGPIYVFSSKMEMISPWVKSGTSIWNAVLTDNVGIGTTSPTNILSLGNSQAQKFWIENSATDVVGRALTMSAGGTLTGTSVNNVIGGNLILQSGLGTGTGASTISFMTGTTLTTGKVLQTMSEKMTILGNGWVGIGTTNPLALFHIESTGPQMVWKDSDATSGLQVFRIINNAGLVNLQIRSDANDSLVRNILVFDNSTGNVGIETTSPGVKLDVSGAGRFTSDTVTLTDSTIGAIFLDTQNYGIKGRFIIYGGTNPYYRNLIQVNSSNQVYIGDDSGSVQGIMFEAGTTPNSNLYFRTQSSEMMRITTTGNVGIGTTSPNRKLSVWDGDAGIQNSGTLGSESLTDGTFTNEPVAGKWTLGGTDWDAAFTGNKAVYAHSGGSGTLNQSSGDLTITVKARRWYKFVYTVSSVTAGCTATITTAVAAAAQTLTLTAATQTLYFLSADSPTNFIISVTSTAGGFSLDGLSLTEIQGGDIYLGGDLYVGPHLTTTGAQIGTLTNAPTVGNPVVYIKIKVGNTYYAVPGWAIP